MPPTRPHSRPTTRPPGTTQPMRPPSAGPTRPVPPTTGQYSETAPDFTAPTRPPSYTTQGGGAAPGGGGPTSYAVPSPGGLSGGASPGLSVTMGGNARGLTAGPRTTGFSGLTAGARTPAGTSGGALSIQRGSDPNARALENVGFRPGFSGIGQVGGANYGPTGGASEGGGYRAPGVSYASAAPPPAAPSAPAPYQPGRLYGAGQDVGVGAETLSQLATPQRPQPPETQIRDTAGELGGAVRPAALPGRSTDVQQAAYDFGTSTQAAGSPTGTPTGGGTLGSALGGTPTAPTPAPTPEAASVPQRPAAPEASVMPESQMDLVQERPDDQQPRSGSALLQSAYAEILNSPEGEMENHPPAAYYYSRARVQLQQQGGAMGQDEFNAAAAVLMTQLWQADLPKIRQGWFWNGSALTPPESAPGYVPPLAGPSPQLYAWVQGNMSDPQISGWYDYAMRNLQAAQQPGPRQTAYQAEYANAMAMLQQLMTQATGSQVQPGVPGNPADLGPLPAAQPSTPDVAPAPVPPAAPAAAPPPAPVTTEPEPVVNAAPESAPVTYGPVTPGPPPPVEPPPAPPPAVPVLEPAPVTEPAPVVATTPEPQPAPVTYTAPPSEPAPVPEMAPSPAPTGQMQITDIPGYVPGHWDAAQGRWIPEYVPPGWQYTAAGWTNVGGGQDVGWFGAGEEAPTDSWRYDVGSGGDGGWLAPGSGADVGGTQISMGRGFNPQSRGGGVNITLSPEGSAAPPDSLAWTPATGMFGAGQDAPVEHANYSIRGA